MLDLLPPLVVVFEEFEPCLVLETIFYVKCQGEVVEDILTFGGVVVSHCVEKGLLVSYEIIVY